MSATATAPPDDWIAGLTTSPNEVLNYCLQHDILLACCMTVDLARHHFPAGSNVSLSLEGDGESEGLWLIVHLGVKAPPAEVFGLFDRFVDSWIDRISTSAQHRMRLTYSAM
jgi:hypothetical protein